MDTQMSNLQLMLRSPRKIFRLLGYALVVLSVLFWYYIASEWAGSFTPADLGVVYLRVSVFVLFLSVCLVKGFTVWRVILLAVPFAVTTFLEPMLIWPKWSQDPQADLHTLQRLTTIAFSHLTVMLAWVVSFPLPFAWERMPSERRAVWKRTEWVLAAVLAAGLLTHAFSMTALIERAPLLETVVEKVRNVVGSGIQFEVLLIYFFVLFRVGLRLELQAKYGRSPSTGNSVAARR